MKLLANWWFVVFLVFIVDRLSKLLFVSFVPLNQSVEVFSFFWLSHVLNTGTLFGLFQDSQLFFILFAVLVCSLIIWKRSSFSAREQLLLSFVVGGALGNLVDRFVYGGVVDFFDFRIWPAFNIADMAISLSVVALLFFEFRKK